MLIIYIIIKKMTITVHIISNNYTNYKQTKIYQKINNITELIDYINKYNIISYPDFNIYYNIDLVLPKAILR